MEKKKVGRWENEKVGTGGVRKVRWKREHEGKSGGVWNKIYENRDDEISKITKIIEDLHSRNLDIYVNVNNHYEGSAPLTIEKIRQQLFGNT